MSIPGLPGSGRSCLLGDEAKKGSTTSMHKNVFETEVSLGYDLGLLSSYSDFPAEDLCEWYGTQRLSSPAHQLS